ncbi:hypothetical protein NDU88_007173 [Pleurodeles waltl]|uniref:Uncharacterized protein n=1 Tax=Pleurodeles waltl TaxID=8319 RepID=A0AAV7N1D0_PLEWA|nr:hypothetical protein NDU88_007173 [Pleurodeles waltl]
MLEAVLRPTTFPPSRGRCRRASQFTIGHMAPASVWVIGHSFVHRAQPFFNLYRSRAQDTGLRFLWIARGVCALMVFASSSRRFFYGGIRRWRSLSFTVIKERKTEKHRRRL